MSDNIDPTLHDTNIRRNNPALNFITALNVARATATASTSAINQDTHDRDDEEELPPAGSLAQSVLPVVSERVNFGRIVKSHVNLSNQSQATLDDFCVNPSSEEREILIYAKLLQLEDFGREARKVESFQGLSDELKKSIRVYTQAFVLSTALTAYRGNCAEHVLKAMRAMHIQDIPSEKDVARVAMVLRNISSSLTTARNTFKSKVASSLETDSPTRNIAHLTHAVIKKTQVPATLQLYMRIAFLRWHFLMYPNLPDDEFWVNVDETLEIWRTELKDSTALSAAFNKCYVEDKTNFGDPADSGREVAEPNSAPEFVKTLHQFSSKVQGLEVKKSRKNSKRKRVEEDTADE